MNLQKKQEQIKMQEMNALLNDIRAKHEILGEKEDLVLCAEKPFIGRGLPN